jgi:hypothetical protein
MRYISNATFAFATLALTLTSGCATVTRGSKDVLEINTTPGGAQVQTSNGLTCASTPCALKLPRRSELVVNITRKRCKPVAVNVTNKTSGGGGAALAGNIIVGGIIGLGVDAATGAAQELVPNPINVVMECRK